MMRLSPAADLFMTHSKRASIVRIALLPYKSASPVAYWDEHWKSADVSNAFCTPLSNVQETLRPVSARCLFRGADVEVATPARWC